MASTAFYNLSLHDVGTLYRLREWTQKSPHSDVKMSSYHINGEHPPGLPSRVFVVSVPGSWTTITDDFDEAVRKYVNATS